MRLGQENLPDGLMLVICSGMANAYNKLNEADSAAVYFQKAFNYESGTHNRRDAAMLYYLYGSFLKEKKGDSSGARKALLRAYTLFGEQPDAILGER